MKLTQCNTYYYDVASWAAGNHFGKDYIRTVNYYATSAIITRAMHTNWDVNDPKTNKRDDKRNICLCQKYDRLLRVTNRVSPKATSCRIVGISSQTSEYSSNLKRHKSLIRR